MKKLILILALIQGITAHADECKTFSECSGITTTSLSIPKLSDDSATKQKILSGDDRYISPIPEPGTYAMFAVGLITVGYVARRKNKK